MAVPCSQFAHCRCPAHRSRPSSWYAVSAQTRRSDSSVWTISTGSSGHPLVTPHRVGRAGRSASVRPSTSVPAGDCTGADV